MTSSPPAASLSNFEELSHYLVPPGEGVFAVSTGRAQREAASARYLGVEEVKREAWRFAVEKALQARVAMLAIPSDNGAGIVRGAARGPEAIREALGHAPCAEFGDVFSIPHLLDDDMLNGRQIEQCQIALYPNVDPTWRKRFPVSPLSMAGRVAALIHTLAPDLRLFALGGDHSVTWPIIRELAQCYIAADRVAQLGILHFDAHTDLSPIRLGVDYCFATWAYHANLLLGRDQPQGPNQRLLQIGIRASARSQEHWESTQGVRQIWAKEARDLRPVQLANLVVEHFLARGVTDLYVTNDIDATDSHWAAACGTPEADGLEPDAILAILEALRDGPFRIVGGDLVEVAPGLSLDAAASARTVDCARSYALAMLETLQLAP
jgi:agmatinase